MSGETLRKLGKLATLLREPAYRPALRHGVAAAAEHDRVPFDTEFRSIVDAGAGRGQFALVATRRFPEAAVYCFEPLEPAREKLNAVTRRMDNVRVFDLALGAVEETATLHVSRNLDSSSLLPMTPMHGAAFPGTEVGDAASVPVVRLEDVLDSEQLPGPALLKIDAQGYELDVLRGAGRLMPSFVTVLVECSFVELYAGQALADEVICFLHRQGLRLRGVFSVARDAVGRCLQADMLFEREPGDPGGSPRSMETPSR